MKHRYRMRGDGVLPYTLDDVQECFRFLDELRESGVTNMYGAGQYVQKEYGIDRQHATILLTAWMHAFDKDGTTATEEIVTTITERVRAIPARDE